MSCYNGFTRTKIVAISLHKASDLKSPFWPDVATFFMHPAQPNRRPLWLGFCCRSKEDMLWPYFYHSATHSKVDCMFCILLQTWIEKFTVYHRDINIAAFYSTIKTSRKADNWNKTFMLIKCFDTDPCGIGNINST